MGVNIYAWIVLVSLSSHIAGRILATIMIFTNAFVFKTKKSSRIVFPCLAIVFPYEQGQNVHKERSHLQIRKETNMKKIKNTISKTEQNILIVKTTNYIYRNTDRYEDNKKV